MAFIKERLKQRRLDMGLTLQEVADILGVEKPTVQRYESGKIKSVDTVTVEKLSEIIKCSPSWLMGWTNEIKNTTGGIIDSYDKLNHLGKCKVDEYIKDLLENAKYTTKDKSLGNTDNFEFASDITHMVLDKVKIDKI